MGFELLDSFSIPGDPDKPNEDAFGVMTTAAVVLDGATGLGDPLMPGKSDAAWLAQFGARRIRSHLQEGADSREATRCAMADAERSFLALRRRAPDETCEIPFASMLLLAARQSRFEALWFGDCAALVKKPSEPVVVLGDTLAKRELEAARVARLAAAHKLAPAAGHNRPEFLHALRRARNMVNTEKGGWLFGPDPVAADHASECKLDLPKDTLLLLATDGFLALVSDYRAYNAEGLVTAAASHGLAELGRLLRHIEAADAEGQQYPRFKASDDATALLLRIA